MHFSNLFLKYEHNIKKTWKVLKESTGKGKCNIQSFPKKIKLDGKNITDEELIAKQFNAYFTKIGNKFAKKIQASSLNFTSFMENYNNTQSESTLIVNELIETFFSLKINKSPGYDDISFNVVRNCFGPLLKPLMAIFNLSLQKGCFPEELKISRVTPIYKADDVNEIVNYRTILVLPCFSKYKKEYCLIGSSNTEQQMKHFIKTSLISKRSRC